jgi:hypothetical protein
MRPHRFDPVSLAFGLLFVLAGSVLLSGEVDLADLSGRGILMLPVLFVGVLLVSVGIRRLLADRVAAAPTPGSEDDVDADGDGNTDTAPPGG